MVVVLSQPLFDNVPGHRSAPQVPADADDGEYAGYEIALIGSHTCKLRLPGMRVVCYTHSIRIHVNSAHPSTSDFRKLFEAAPGPYLVLAPDLTIVAISDAYLKATMTERDVIVGRGLFDVFPDNPDDPQATGTQNLRASLNRVLENRARDTMAIQKYDIRRPESEGGGFEERHWSPSNSPVLGDDGQVKYIIHYVEDVTESVRRVDAEAAERRYRLLFDSNPNPMWVFDVETLQFLAVNNAAVMRYGYSREEFLTMTIADIRPSEDMPKVRAALESGDEVPTSWRHHAKDGSAFDVEVTSHCLVFDGRPARLSLVVDVTERKRLEEQLRQSQKLHAIGQLAGGIAHDFNNLLTAITCYADLLLQNMPASDDRRADVLEITKAADLAANLTGHLLAFSRKQVLQPTVLNINDAVSDIEKMLRRVIGEHIELSLALDSDAGYVKVDRGQLEQVLLNLAVNARDAMPHSGKLSIRTSSALFGEEYARTHQDVAPGDYVELTVNDTGCGMTKEVRVRVFEPFFTTKERGKGTGLGLSTVYGIVKQSDGHIWLYSEVGVGTSFKVYLPRVTSVGDGVPLSAPAELAQGTETILVVDDDDMIRGVACRVLRENGYTVLEARSGREAIERAERHDGVIHATVTDVVMPGMTGRALSERLSSMRPEMRIMFMSGYADDAIMEHAVLDNGVILLNKPFTPGKLLQKLREVLNAADVQRLIA